MYLYDDYDRQVVQDRVTQFKGQIARYLRLQNGLYVQKHAPMLRVAA